MAYPLSIASLHFQYKTAFDVLKAYMPDKNDDELSQMVLDFKTKKDESKPKKESKKAPQSTPSETPKKESKKAPLSTPSETEEQSTPSESPKKESKTKKPKV